MGVINPDTGPFVNQTVLPRLRDASPSFDLVARTVALSFFLWAAAARPV